MATIPTQNAVPSEAARDLKFNSGKIDEFVTSLEHEYKDRFGRCHMTIEGMRWIFEQLMERFKVDINQAIIAAGYIPMDSFQQGAEITKRNEILRDETTGEYYRWDGDLPKTVPAGSTPESAGGVGIGAWVSVGDASLRSQLSSPAGSALIGHGDKTVADAIDSSKHGVDVINNSRMWAVNPFRLELIAHRGFQGIYPESTLLSFSNCDSKGATSVEFDVQVSIDGVPYVFHDLWADNLTINGVGEFVKQSSSYIDTFKFKITQGTRFHDCKVPKLEDVLKILKRKGMMIYPELKGVNSLNDVKVITDMLDKYGMLPQSIITSFHIDRLEKAREYTDIPLALSGTTVSSFDEDINTMSNFGNGMLFMDYKTFLLIPDAMKKARSIGVDIILWTIDNENALRDCMQAGCNRICSNMTLSQIGEKC
ncbi:glycerophosphodiester phosphodiesterase family protein [Morganella morganii]|uniref:tail fiber/spike domain-containing protein n=1 Tax=Morganella morganii TaxID=582 RepID=UPI0031E832D3